MLHSWSFLPHRTSVTYFRGLIIVKKGGGFPSNNFVIFGMKIVKRRKQLNALCSIFQLFSLSESRPTRPVAPLVSCSKPSSTRFWLETLAMLCSTFLLFPCSKTTARGFHRADASSLLLSFKNSTLIETLFDSQVIANSPNFVIFCYSGAVPMFLLILFDLELYRTCCCF